MSEEEIKILDYIIKKIEECMNNNNVDTNFYLPIGSYGDFGFVSYNMLLNIRNLQQENSQLKNDNAVMKAGLIQIRDEENSQLKERIENAIDYIRGCCNMDSKWTNLHFDYAQNEMLPEQVDDLLEILKGDKE